MTSRRKVLVVEDEYLIATALAEMVGQAGYQVVGPAASVAIAQALINEQGIDAALLDIKLDGDERSFELAARLAALGIPFAFVTAYSPGLWPLEFKTVPHLTKPVGSEGVTKILAALFGPRRIP